MKLNRLLVLRFAALLGAAFMLTVSTGVSISIHYCNGNIIDFAVNKGAEACEGYYDFSSESPVGCSFSRKGCCEDKDWLLVVENEVPPSGISVDQQTTEFIAIDVLPVSQWPSFQFEDLIGLANAPPERQLDYQILHQVFRI